MRLLLFHVRKACAPAFVSCAFGFACTIKRGSRRRVSGLGLLRRALTLPPLFLLSSQVRPDSSSSQPSHCCSCKHTDRWVDSGGSLLSLIAEALAPPRRARLIAEPLAPPRPHPHTCVPTYPRLYTHMNAGCIDGWMMTYRSLSLVLVQPRLSKRLQNTGKNTRGIAKLVLGNGCLALLALPLRLLQMHRTLLPLLLLYIQRSVFVLLDQ